MTVVQSRGNQAGNVPNLGADPSPFIWSDCPVDALLNGTVAGAYFFDTFLTSAFTVPTTEANCGVYKGFSSTGGVMTQASDSSAAANAFGAISLGSDGDDEGASLMTVPLPYKIVGPNSTATARSGKFWFETRVKTSSIADTIADLFVGLGDQMTLSATVPITATAGAMADENWVGFHRLGTDGDYFDCRYKADGVTAVTVGSDAQVIVADTWVKLGMRYDPADNHYLRFYGNGIELCSKQIPAAAGTDFPNDVQMGLVIAILNAAAGSPTFTIDWWRAAQLAA